jgi:hypothetical protein
MVAMPYPRDTGETHTSSGFDALVYDDTCNREPVIVSTIE